MQIVHLPDGEDPDSFSRIYSEEQLREFLEKNVQDALEYHCTSLAEAAKEHQEKANACEKCAELICLIENAITRDFYLKSISNILSISKRELGKTVKKLITDKDENTIKDRNSTDNELESRDN